MMSAIIVPKLTAKQRMFVAEYLKDKNATQAAIRAGYSAKNADKIGSQLLGKTRVAAEIEAGLSKFEKKLDVSTISVLGELAAIGFSNVQDLFDDKDQLIAIGSLPRHVAASISSIEVEEQYDGRGEERTAVGRIKKIKLWDKRAALVSLGEHLNLFDRPIDPDSVGRADMTYIELARRLAYVFNRAAQEGQPALPQGS